MKRNIRVTNAPRRNVVSSVGVYKTKVLFRRDVVMANSEYVDVATARGGHL